MTNEILERVAALEMEVAQLKQQSLTRDALEQLLTYRARMDTNISSMSADIRQMRGGIDQLNNRVQRLEENASVLPELATRVEAIGNDIKRLAQEM